MRIAILAALTLAIVGGFLAYMSSYTVQFTEAAVVTTFGRADAADVVSTPGLRFKWPAPIQSTTVYDTRARHLSTRHETQQTADDRQIIIEAFLTWRVTDPLIFYQRFRGTAGSNPRDHYAKAEETMTSSLRSAMSEVSKYRLGELFSQEQGASKLVQLETDILERMRAPAEKGGGNVGQYGIELAQVGISSIVLPTDTTAEVFNRMSESRKRLAAKAESEGEALATAIRSEAENAAQRIREFARFRAEQIRNKGDVEAAPYLIALNENPELATFLKNLEILREGFGKNATMVIPTTFPGMNLFSSGAMQEAAQGRIPAFTAESKPATTAAPTDKRGGDR